MTGPAAKVRSSTTALTVKKGEAVKLPVTVYDSREVYIDNATLEVSLTQELGTFDAATGMFTGTVAGNGHIIVSSPGAGSATIELIVTE